VPLLQEKETSVLRRELKARPDATLEERQAVLTAPWGTTASVSTISRGVQALELPREKKSARQ
jgi:transposase